jgi:4-carboxymuconolactone decarboxylase
LQLLKEEDLILENRIFREVTAMNKEKFEEGLQIRRAVLGTEYVDKAISQMDDLSRPLQELVTEYCWGTVWSRPELPRKIRSMINLAMLTALNRPHELRIHIRGALNNDCSREEIREVLLQAAIYCGVPAAVDSFRVMREAFAELDGQTKG